MDRLHPNWITEGRIDFEYKKYILLAYLQGVTKYFSENKLYPFLSDLIFHYRNLIALKENKEQTSTSFPKNLKRIDLENFKLEYEQRMHDDAYMDEIQSILDFAIPKLKHGVEDGRELYEFVEDHLEISPIGIIPLNTEFGYLFLKVADKPDTRIYNYEITIFERANERFRSIKTSLADTIQKRVSVTYESMKLELIRNRSDIANPAAFLIQSKLSIPEEETFLPVAKRYFVQFLAKVQKDGNFN